MLFKINLHAHNTTCLKWCFNEVEECITNEVQLVKYIKDRDQLI